MKQASAKFLSVPFVQTLHSRAQDLFPGIAVCVIFAASAEFLSAHYDTPPMLLALLLGMVVSILGEEGKTVPGVAFSARALLRLGVAFLGVRVSMLAPVVLIASLLIRGYVSEQARGKQPPLLPRFVIGFIGLAGLKSFGLISKILTNTLSDAARWMLLTAIAAVGMESNPKQVRSVGPAAIAFIVLETLFITGFILAGLSLLS